MMKRDEWVSYLWYENTLGEVMAPRWVVMVQRDRMPLEICLEHFIKARDAEDHALRLRSIIPNGDVFVAHVQKLYS